MSKAALSLASIKPLRRRMKRLGIVLIGLVVVLLVFGLIISSWFIKVRNDLVALDENVNRQWSQVQNVYQRRLDLIPNLVETVKGYAQHEKDTFLQVTEARARAGSVQASSDVITDPEKFAKFQQAQAQLSSALSRLLVVVEKYPELKANQNFLQLQSQLEGTENRIAVERRRFNDAAREYNVRVRQFPASLVAGMSGFRSKEYFKASDEAQTAPKVKF